MAPHAYITVVNGHTNGMDTVRTAPQAAAARRKRPSLAAKRVQNGPRSLLMVHEHTYCECGESYKSNHRLTGGKQGCSTGSCTSMAVDLPKKVFQASGHPKPDQESARCTFWLECRSRQMAVFLRCERKQLQPWHPNWLCNVNIDTPAPSPSAGQVFGAVKEAVRTPNSVS